MNKRHEIALGLLVLIALVSFVYLSLNVKGFHRFRNNWTLYSKFADATGLVKDSEVKIAGVRAGFVKEIKLEDNTAFVKMAINKSVKIKKGAMSVIKARSILGERYISIVNPEGEREYLRDGDTIHDSSVSLSIEELVTHAGNIISRLNEKNLDNLSSLIKKISSLDIAQMNKLIGDFSSLMESARYSVKSLGEFSSRLNNDKRINEIFSDLEKFTKSLRSVSDELEKRDIGRKIDEIYKKSDKTLGDISPGIKELNEILHLLKGVLTKLDKTSLDKIDKMVDEFKIFLKKDGIKVDVF